MSFNPERIVGNLTVEQITELLQECVRNLDAATWIVALFECLEQVDKEELLASLEAHLSHD